MWEHIHRPRVAAACLALAAALAACAGSASSTPTATSAAGSALASGTPGYPFGGDACQALTDAEITAATQHKPTSHDTQTASGVTGGPHCYWHLPVGSGQDVLAVEFGDLSYFRAGTQSNGGPSRVPVPSLGDQAFFVPYANPDLWFTHGSYMVSVVSMGDQPLSRDQVETLARDILAKAG